MKRKRHFLSMKDISKEDLSEILSNALTMKQKNDRTSAHKLDGKSVAMIFQKPSLRTRVSFEVGIHQLGGHSVYLGADSVGSGHRESVEDMTKSLSRYVDIIVARVFDQSTLEEMASCQVVPIINALSNSIHPCQILSDLLTLKERGKLFDGVKVVFIGDGNNVANAWIEATILEKINLFVISPNEYPPDPSIISFAKANSIGSVTISHDLSDAINADVIYTDTWTSMGQENERDKRKKSFAHFQINDKIMSLAKSDAVFMHCLPAHVGEEVTEQVFKSTNSIVFDQAENRLHAQKALLVKICDWNR